MSDAYIVRRGGGGEGFDPNGAVLKVVTSTNCTVLVTGTGYSKTHQQADGFPRSGDANVTEHFFSIPASAFGTITVKATNTYGDNTKTITVNTAGKVYELLCGGINIILNSTFGLQEGFLNKLDVTGGKYSARYKKIQKFSGYDTFSATITDIPVGPYGTLRISGTGKYSDSGIILRDSDSTLLCNIVIGATTSTKSGAITNKYYAYATLLTYVGGFTEITQIVLS